MARLAACLLTKLEMVLSPENLGPEPPTGSKNQPAVKTIRRKEGQLLIKSIITFQGSITD